MTESGEQLRWNEAVEAGRRARVISRCVAIAQGIMRNDPSALDDGFSPAGGDDFDTPNTAATKPMDETYALKAAGFAEFFNDYCSGFEIMPGESIETIVNKWHVGIQEKMYGRGGLLSFEAFENMVWGEAGLYRHIFGWMAIETPENLVELITNAGQDDIAALRRVPEVRDLLYNWVYQPAFTAQQPAHTIAGMVVIHTANTILQLAHRNSVPVDRDYLGRQLEVLRPFMQLGPEEFNMITDRMSIVETGIPLIRSRYITMDKENGQVAIERDELFTDSVSVIDQVHRSCPVMHVTDQDGNNLRMFDTLIDFWTRAYEGSGALTNPKLRRFKSMR